MQLSPTLNGIVWLIVIWTIKDILLFELVIEIINISEHLKFVDFDTFVFSNIYIYWMVS